MTGPIGVYVITTSAGGRGHVEIAAAALAGGCRWIQYREKDELAALTSREAEKICEMARDAGAKFVVNDYVELALRVGADGLHVGQSDAPLREVRRRFPGLIGVSAANLEEAVSAAKAGADYIGFGPVFPTGSKDDAGPPTGIEALARVRRRLDIPIVAIGGISAQNVEEVVAAGADGVAVISAVSAAADMTAATARLATLFEQGKEKRLTYGSTD